MVLHIVWDLDETLCHSMQEKKEQEYIHHDHEDAYKLSFKDGSSMSGYRRPYAREILQSLKDHGIQQIVWTAGEEEYARKVVEAVFPFKNVKIYSRNDCEHIYNLKKMDGHTLKNLAKLYKLNPNMNPSNTIMIDNRRDIAAMNPNNHIQVTDFIPKYKSKASKGTDNSLLHLCNHIIANKNVSDARMMTGVKF